MPLLHILPDVITPRLHPPSQGHERMDDAVPPPTLVSLFSGDECELIAGRLDLASAAALAQALLPRRPIRLYESFLTLAKGLGRIAPLCSAARDFEEEALWPTSVSAADWRPREWFGQLREEAVCRVAGSGTCSHGLCQKRETPKAGVLEMLEWFGTREATLNGSVRAVCLECIAWLSGAVGRNDAARAAWARAAAAGSPRAQLDIGFRSYRCTGTAATVYYAADSARPPAATSAAGAPRRAESLLRAAASNPSLASLSGLEGHTVRARAAMLLGMMALDGDGSTQDDAAAQGYFERALLAARAGLACRNELPRGSEVASWSSYSLHLTEWANSYSVALADACTQVEEDAVDTLQSMDLATPSGLRLR